MIKILAIGNSFSQDATAYLYDMARTVDFELKVVNLYIGGCSLERHWNNMIENRADYDYELNGSGTGRKISIQEALQEEAWDYIILQQVSGDSGRINTYFPYITDLLHYLKQSAPEAQPLLHQTWAYELDSNHPDFSKYENNQQFMYEALRLSYREVAETLSLPVIPSGDIIQKLRRTPAFDYANGGMSLCRDGFHMSLIYGRYVVAAVWYEYLTGKSIVDNSFFPKNINWDYAEPEIIQHIKDAVHHALEGKKHEKQEN